jgi:two-component system response regulator FixJ
MRAQQDGGAGVASIAAEETVVLVDDDDAVRDSLKLLLESHGMAVLDFDGAATFLAGYRNGQGGCLILDLHLPILGGLDLIRMMEQRNIALPVIFITGRSDPGVKARALEAGAVAFLEKPVEEAVLMNAIRMALRSATKPASGGPAETAPASPRKPRA